MGVAGEHYDTLNPVAAHLVFNDLVSPFLALLDKAVAGDDYELLPLGVVPVLPLGYARPGDVDADLTAVHGADELGEGAPLVAVHLQVEDGLLLRKVAEVGAEQALGEAVGGNLRNHQSLRHVVELTEKRHNLAEGHVMGDR